MPHRRKKPFIEKKKAVTFHLVHRSQRDPLAADETAPQRVLLPTEKAEAEKRQEEQRKFGVFFDDEYDYLQHLKEVGPLELVASGKPRPQSRIIVTESGEVEEEEEIVQTPAHSINLPSSVFASEFEENVGLLNKAAPISGPRLDMDPDIVAALDDDFDFDDPENQLDDDFVIKANDLVEGDQDEGGERSRFGDDDDGWEDMEDDGEGSTSDEDFDSDTPLSEEGEGESGNGPPKEFLFLQEEIRSRFTEYSMTSSVMKRNEQLTLLDERFEKFYEQFDEDEIGALDNAELEGFIQSQSSRLQEVINDYYKQKAKDCVKLEDLEPRDGVEALANEDDSSEENEEMETLVIEEPGEKWDCESILSSEATAAAATAASASAGNPTAQSADAPPSSAVSSADLPSGTYSNLYNHPQLIKEPPKAIKVSVKTGIPVDVLPQRGLTAKQVERMQLINDCDLPRASTQQRDKAETKEERKARKHAIKNERKERRVEKKANKEAFKVEKTRQEKEQLNLRQNLQGLKLS